MSSLDVAARPPKSFERSIMTTRWPWSAAVIAATRPATLAPTTISPVSSLRAPDAIAAA